MSISTKLRITPVKIIVLGGFILLAVSAWGWWRFIYSSPTAVFDRMLKNGLSTTSFTKVVNQSDTDQNLAQTVQILGDVQRIHAVNTLTQNGDQKSTVVTESIGTPKTDFVRYTSIDTTQKTTAGKEFDFKNVLGVWGRSGGVEEGGAQLFSQNVLGVVPVGNLPAAQRKALLQQMKQTSVFSYDAASVNRHRVNGRLIYTYDIKLMPAPYVAMLKSYAHDIGLTQLEEVDPNQYAGSAPLSFTFDVDVLAGQLVGVTYKNQDPNSKRHEAFTSYGARQKLELPDQSITLDELQTRLQQIQ